MWGEHVGSVDGSWRSAEQRRVELRVLAGSSDREAADRGVVPSLCCRWKGMDQRSDCFGILRAARQRAPFTRRRRSRGMPRASIRCGSRCAACAVSFLLSRRFCRPGRGAGHRTSCAGSPMRSARPATLMCLPRRYQAVGLRYSSRPGRYRMNGIAFVRVWDPLVRVGHWALVAAFAVAYLTEDDLLGVHVWAGYVVGIILVARLSVGICRSSLRPIFRFRSGPGQVFAYLRDLVLFRARRYIGHSPGGGAMVIALLFVLRRLSSQGSWFMARRNTPGHWRLSSPPTPARSSCCRNPRRGRREGTAASRGRRKRKTKHLRRSTTS